MGEKPIQSIGGQVVRLDFSSEAYQARLNPGRLNQIPQASIGTPGNGAQTLGQGLPGWERYELALALASQAFATGHDAKSKARANGQRESRHRSLQSIEIDRPQPMVKPPPPPKRRMSLDEVHESIATFEEQQRDHQARSRRGGAFKTSQR